MSSIAFLGIGSDLGDRKRNISNSLAMIADSVGEIVSTSSVYETEPWGFNSEANFFNMVISIRTALSPAKLLKKVLNIEILMGRIRGTEKYSSRIIDIDILLYGNRVIKKPYLKVPHPMIQERKFVLVPICEIAPEMIHPVLRKTFAQLLKECKDGSDVKKVIPL